MRGFAPVLLRTAISIGLIGLILFSVDFATVMQAFTKLHFLTVFFSLILLVLGVAVSTLKWQGFLSEHGIVPPFGRLLVLYLIGLFFNNFLPTTVGGDMARATLLCRSREPRAEVITSIFAERLTGLMAVVVCGSIGFLIVPELVREGAPALGLFVVGGVIMSGLLLSERLRQTLRSFMPAKLTLALERFAHCLSSYLRNRQVLVRAAWSSMLFQLIVAATYFLVGRDIGLHVGFVTMLVVVSLVTLLTLLPISINGLGLREGGFIYLLGTVGVGRPEALALSLIVYAMVLGFSLSGGVAFILWQREGKRSGAKPSKVI